MINDMLLIDDIFDADLLNHVISVTDKVEFEDGNKTLAPFAKGAKKTSSCSSRRHRNCSKP